MRPRTYRKPCPLIQGLFPLALILFFSAPLNLSAERETDLNPVQRGLVDLRSLSSDRLVEPIRLSGDWAFFWNELDPATSATPTAFGPIEANWIAAFSEANPEVEAHGYATYRIHVLLPPVTQGQLWAIRTRAQNGPVLLRVNGREIMRAGTPVAKASEAVSHNGMGQASIVIPVEGKLQIDLAISNHEHFRGGAGGAVILGPEDVIRKESHRIMAADTFVAACLFLFGIYHLGMYTIRRQEKAALFFGLFCLLISVRTVITGEAIIREIWPEVPYLLENRLGYFTYFAAVPLALLYFFALFSRQRLRWVVHALAGAGGIASIVGLLPFLGRSDLAQMASFYHVYTIIVLCMALGIAVAALWRKEPGSRMFLAGFLVLSASALHDIIQNIGLLDTPPVVPVGLMIFVFSQAFLIYARFSRTFQEVEQLSGALHEKNADLEHMARVKDEFLAHLSHELRTPLTLIQGSAEIMEMKTAKEDAFQQNSLRRILEGSATLSSYVDDLMLVTDVETAPDLRLSAVDLADCCRLAILATENLADEEKVSVKLEGSDTLPFTGDQRLLQRMIYSLVKNAVLYNLAGGQVTIRTSIEGNKPQIEIQNTGPGIPETEREAVFDKFHRLDLTRAGVGLGLFLARKIARLHGGDISLKATGPITLFRVVLSEGQGAPAVYPETRK